MNREKLRKLLVEKEIDPSCYVIDEHFNEDADGAYCLEKRDNGWYVFCLDRGQKFDEHIFEAEEKACKYIYDRLISTDSTRKGASEDHEFCE